MRTTLERHLAAKEANTTQILFEALKAGVNGGTEAVLAALELGQVTETARDLARAALAKLAKTSDHNFTGNYSVL